MNRWRVAAAAVRRPGFLLACGGAWIAVVAGSYALLIPRLPALNVRAALAGAERFVLWQALGFLLVLAFALVRPRRAGMAAAVYLGASTVLLLASAGSLALVFGFLAFAAWLALAVQSVRVLLRRVAGAVVATWGLAATFLYALLIPVAFGLGVAHLVRLRTLVPLAVLLAVPGILTLPRALRAWHDKAGRLATLGPFGVVGLEVAWLALAIAFVWASVPESGSDSSRVYLPFARDVAITQGFEVQAIDWHRLVPMAVPAVWADAFKLGGEQAAKWLSWAALVALAALVWEEVGGRARSRAIAATATAVVLSCPLLSELAGTLYVDHVVVLLAVGAFIALERGLARWSRPGVVASAVIAAALAQTKYTSGLLVVAWVAVLVVAARGRLGWSRGLRWCAPVLAVLVVLALPWYAYTYATTGDPVFPFLHHWFPSRFWPGSLPTTLGQERFESPGSLLGWLRFPWTATFDTSRISLDGDGALGFALLALLPVALGARAGRRASLGAAVGGLVLFVGLAPSSTNARYWLPSYVLLLLWLMATAAARFRRSRLRVSRGAGAAIVVAMTAVMALPFPIWLCRGWGPYRFPWDVYAGTTSRERYLGELLPGFPAIEALNARLGPQDRVLVTADLGVHLVKARAYEFPFWLTSVAGIADAAAMDRFLSANGIKYWLVDHTELDDSAYFAAFGAPGKYWTPARLVAAEGTIAAYRVQEATTRPTMASVGEVALEPRLGTDSDWVGDATGGAGARVLSPLNVKPEGTVVRTVAVPAEAGMARWSLRVGGEPGTTVVERVEWLDGGGRQTGSQEIANVVPNGLGPVTARLFARVPQGTVSGQLVVWSSPGFTLGHGSVDFWRDVGAPAGPGREPNVEGIFPSEIVAGEAFNAKPGGASELAVPGQFAAGHRHLVVLDGQVLPHPTSAAAVVTAQVPRRLVESPGAYEVFVVDATAGAQSRPLTLLVRRGAVVPPADVWRRSIRIDSLYPRTATAAQPFNVQADGSSWVAIQGELPANRTYEVIVDGDRPPESAHSEGVVAFRFPAEAGRVPGEHEVFVVDPIALERSNALYFALGPPAQPAGGR